MIAVLVITGCSKKEASGNGGASASPDQTLTLTIMSVDSTKSGYADWIADIEKACNLKITTIDMPTNTHDRQAKITTILSSGDSSVDIFTINDEMYTAFKNTGWLEPLQNTVMTGEVQQQYPQGYLKDMATARNGSIYTVPMYFNVLGFFVNQQKMKEAGLSSIDTYDDFITFITKTSGNGKWGYGGAWETTYVFNEIGTFVNLFGGDFFDWNNPKTQQAVKLMYDMCHSLKATPLSQLADQYDPMRQNLIDGTYASCFMWATQIARVRDAEAYGDDKIKMVVPPTFETRSAYCSAWHFVLNSASKNKEAARRFLTYSTTKEAGMSYSKTFGNMPARMDVIMDPSFSLTGIEEFRTYMQDVTIRGRPMVPETMEHIAGIGALFQQLVTDEINMDTFFRMAQQETEKYL
ncbi:ABC transporter substrate-binding protein [Breznakiella homolactica]|uniref:Extracellular solute-binding protein n=1 Tax=Breznakiella homolactica TaxID=2798577 RepID=A0A7T8BBA8_9SPIR|nr:extracellular solute-binding protein [Breznakiella homolactica]QQO09845.1 extracellular solute-binding protein [Breznakiella homolactica]